MTKYREILRLRSMGFSQNDIAASCQMSKKTVNKVLKLANEHNLCWPLEERLTDREIDKIIHPNGNEARKTTDRKLPDFDHVKSELLRNGVNKKLLWAEYLEECKLENAKPLMYSQFCHYILQDERVRRATMHINRKPGEQIEVDWAGDPAYVIDPETGERKKAFVFVGVLNYSMYAYAEAFPDEKQKSWNDAHIHMFEFFGGVSKMLVPDNCKTAVVHNRKHEDELNSSYQELAEHYGTAIIPARVRAPKDKASAEGTVGNVSTWIVAALRNEEFFSIGELNCAIRKKLEEYNERPFQKKEGSRKRLFDQEERTFLLPLPRTRYENASWRSLSVQFNYHVCVDGNFYSVPFGFIGKKVDVRETDSIVEIFDDGNRIASHAKLLNCKGKYNTLAVHMPEKHQKFLEWDGDRFRNWARKIGYSVLTVIERVLASKPIEQQAYKACMAILSLAKDYTDASLEAACERVISFGVTPTFKNIQNLLAANGDRARKSSERPRGITRGAEYYRREND